MAISKSGNATTNPLVVGTSALGTVTIDSGSDLTVAYGKAGVLAAGDGTIAITGAGSTLTISAAEPKIGLGIYGTGTMNVSNGGAVYALGIGLGTQNGGVGTLNISGSGSKVVLSNDHDTAANYYAGGMAVGEVVGGTGFLSVTGGALLVLRNTNGELAPTLSVGARGTGTALIDGKGTTLTITQTDVPASFSGNGAFLQSGGRGGLGSLTISNNAQVNMTAEYGTFRVARGHNENDPGAPARLGLSEAKILSGADVTMNMTGGNYYGALCIVGARTNANGRLTVDGEGSSLTIHGDNAGSTSKETAMMMIASNGMGDLVLSNGADVLIDAGDDQRPMFMVGVGEHSIGTASLSGAGTTLSLATTNTSAGEGGYVAVGRWSGSDGSLSITDGAQLINNAGSLNSIMTVGRSGAYNSFPASKATVTVDGNGNAATLLDAGHLLVIGADWNPDGGSSSIGDVGFDFGGTGSVTVLDGATVRADDTAIGVGGTVTGNGTFDGNVKVSGGGHIAPGASAGTLSVTGTLDLDNAVLDLDVKGAAAGLFDQIAVGGNTALNVVTFNLNTDPAFNFTRGDKLVLIAGASKLTYADPDGITVNITGEPAGLAYSISDQGGSAIFEALNSGKGRAVLDFGSAKTNGATADLNDGVGTGAGGVFDGVKFVGVSIVSGTAGDDQINAGGTAAYKLFGKDGHDDLAGGSGKDKLSGDDGNDLLVGNAGVDRLTGGAGIDDLVGGTKKDVYFFKKIGDSGTGAAADTIHDFSQADADKIHLARIDAQASVGKNNAFTFTGNGGADGFTKGVEGQIHIEFSGGDTVVQLEIDGDGVADSEIFLVGTHNLLATDFVL